MKKFFSWLDRTFIKPVEDSKMSLGTFILIAAGYILVRNLAEGAFESLHTLGLATLTLHGLEETFLHLMFSWFYLFLCLIILMWITSGHDFRKITRVLLTYSFFILIPVIIDPLLRPGGFRLAYPTDIRIIPQAFSIVLRPWILLDPNMLYKYGPDLPYGASPGMFAEALVGIIVIAVYGGLRAKPRWRKILAVLLAPAVAIGGMFFAGVAQVAVNWIPYTAPASGLDAYHSGGLINSATRKYAMIILVPFLLLLILGLWLYNRKKTKLLIKAPNPIHLVIGAVAAVVGYFFAWMHLKDVLVNIPGNPFDYISIVVLAYLGLTTVALVTYLSKAFSPTLKEDDRKTFKRGAWGMFILSMALAWSLGYSVIFIFVVALVFGLILTLPPLRLERIPIASSLVRTMSVYMLVFCGFSLFTSELTFNVFPWKLALVVFAALFGIFLVLEILDRWVLKGRAKAFSQSLES